MYQPTDKYLVRLKKKIRCEFNYLSVLSFDELNVIRVRKETQEMFKRLLDFNSKEYKEIVSRARGYAIAFLNEEQKRQEASCKLECDSFVEYVLTTYNSVTGYLYKKEAERKRLRLSEEMLTAREFRDRKRYTDSLKRAANLWFTQSGQYAIDLEDKTVLNIWEKAGIKKVKWLAEDDHKTCEHCKSLDGKVFEIDKVPHKAHYYCRCIVIPSKDT